MTNRERWVIAAVLLAGFALRLAFAFQDQFDTDENQHLHVVWSLRQGQLLYRDVFDNHTPLFSVLMVPVAALFGERADILTGMRLAMLPILLGILWLTYAIARPFFGRARAGWAVALLNLAPGFAALSAQFRPLDLWLFLWLLALRLLMARPLTPWRGFLAGLAVGVNLCVSLKTLLMVFALGGAGALLWLLSEPARRGPAPARRVPFLAAFVAGALAAPAAAAAWFAARGAWQSFLYCTVLHNLIAEPGAGHPAAKALLFLGGLGFTALGTRALMRRKLRPLTDTRTIFLLLLAGTYLSLLAAWPLPTRQTVAPAIPLLLVLGTGLLPGTSRDGGRRGRSAGVSPAGCAEEPHDAGGTPALPSVARADGAPLHAVACGALLLAALVSVAYALAAHKPWRNETASNEALLADVLRLTGPADYVMDLKGDQVFRRRPFYPVLETITCMRMERGLIRDEIRPRCIETRTCVVVMGNRPYPPDGQAFIEHNYVSVGAVRVAGKWLCTHRVKAGQRFAFTLEIPGEYAWVDARGCVAGRIDGVPCAGTALLEAGPHEFVPDAPCGRFAVLWARAARLGYRAQP